MTKPRGAWKQADVFPIIAQVIRDAYAKERRYITHSESTAGLLADPAASRIIEEAQQQDKQQILEWLAHNMVAWFSERITVDQSDWADAFDRTKIDDRWAYKPKEHETNG